MIYLQALHFSFEDMKAWYNGYYTPDGTRLYNPWSVASALTQGRLRSYWAETGNKVLLSIFLTVSKLILSQGYDHIIQGRIDHFLDNDKQFRAQVSDLIANVGTRIELEDDMSYHSFVIHSLPLTAQVLNHFFSVEEISPRQFWTLAYYAGYLTKPVNGSRFIVKFCPVLT
jgi:hypothetical protein